MISARPPMPINVAACISGSAYLWRTPAGEWIAARHHWLPADEALPGSEHNKDRQYGRVRKILHWQTIQPDSADLSDDQRKDFAAAMQDHASLANRKGGVW